MSNRLIIHIILFWIFSLALNSCKKDDINTSTYTPPVNPINPVAPVLNQTCKARLYNLDITFNTSVEMIEDYNNPWDYGADPESYYDLTIIDGEGIIDSLGEFKVSIIEYADTATLNYAVASYFIIYQGNCNPIYISGSSSINFKKLFRQGGGSFEGNFTISSGSVQNCDQSGGIYYNPLTVTGALDVASKMINMNIKGKAYL